MKSTFFFPHLTPHVTLRFALHFESIRESVRPIEYRGKAHAAVTTTIDRSIDRTTAMVRSRFDSSYHPAYGESRTRGGGKAAFHPGNDRPALPGDCESASGRFGDRLRQPRGTIREAIGGLSARRVILKNIHPVCGAARCCEDTRRE